jgi:hypothetical protein
MAVYRAEIPPRFTNLRPIGRGAFGCGACMGGFYSLFSFDTLDVLMAGWSTQWAAMCVAVVLLL